MEGIKKKIPKVKICGITTKEEAAFLNEAGADYAGFVFFPKSKRNVTCEQAESIFPYLDKKIQKVAVLVSPALEEVQKVEAIGIDILQIHGTLTEEVRKKSRHPIWRAINLKKAEETEKEIIELLGEKEKTPEDRKTDDGAIGKIAGIVVDGAEYGGGRTFDWEENKELLQLRETFKEQKFILAGGLHAGNVKQGISIFAPDIVDVSSGVENDNGIGKNRDKIMEFIRKVKDYE